MSAARKTKRLTRKRLASLMFRVLNGHRISVTISKAGGVLVDRRVFVECQKVKYGHEATAEKAGVAMQKKTGDHFDAYYCRRCKAWHIGHAR